MLCFYIITTVLLLLLLELCRKANGYPHVSMSLKDVQPLYNNYNNFTEYINHSVESLTKLMTTPHTSSWMNGNKFIIPNEWIVQTIKLYLNKNVSISEVQALRYP